MFPLPKYAQFLVSVGHAIIFSMALVGGVRIISGIFGAPISPEVANRIFGISALVTMPLAAYFNLARLMVPVTKETPAS